MPRKANKPNGSARGVADPFPNRANAANLQMPQAAPPTNLSAPKQVQSILELFVSRSAYILRLNDSRYTPIALAVAREIKAGTLIVITPTDTKIFELGEIGNAQLGIGNTQAVRQPAPLPPPTIPGDLEQYVEEDLEPDIQDETMQIAEENDQQLNPEMLAAIEQETQQPRRRQKSPATPNAVCGRCEGAGVTKAGGGCPVCHGSGVIVSWGRSPKRQ